MSLISAKVELVPDLHITSYTKKFFEDIYDEDTAVLDRSTYDRGIGKTFSGNLWVVLQCLLNDNCISVVGSGNGRRIAVVNVFKAIKFIGCKVEFKPMEYSFHFRNGAQIKIMDVAYRHNDPFFEKFGSLELGSVYLDDTYNVHKDAIDILRSRIRNFPQKMILT